MAPASGLVCFFTFMLDVC
uniref:Uncharacterized protein n=1 Tax=Anguilla anguilla TaxID=7936 RepID=A0A0E9PGA9_ANGAN